MGWGALPGKDGHLDLGVRMTVPGVQGGGGHYRGRVGWWMQGVLA